MMTAENKENTKEKRDNEEVQHGVTIIVMEEKDCNRRNQTKKFDDNIAVYCTERCITPKNRKGVTLLATLLIILLIIMVGVLLGTSNNKNEIANDRCVDAILLPTNGTVVKGSFTGATHDPKVRGDCVASSDPEGGNVAVWYEFQGTGDALQINAPSIAIFTGTCGQLTTAMTPKGKDGLRYNHVYETENGICDSQNYTFHSESGEMYYLYVAACPHDWCKHDFDVSVHPIRSPANDLCANATNLLFMDKNTYNGTFTNATWDDVDLSAAATRGGIPWNPPPGVWYRFDGEGENRKLRIESKAEAGVMLFQSTVGCSHLQRVDFEDTFSPVSNGTLTMDINIKGNSTGATYFLYIFQTSAPSENEIDNEFTVSDLQ